MTDRVKGKVAIVTGAGSVGPGWGNGKATAVLYAREGASVFLVDYDLDAANVTRAVIEQEGGECSVFEADVTDSQAVEQMAAACIETYGRIDILHNNVGIIEVGGPVEVSEENWDRLMDVNVKGMFLTCKFCIPHMERQGGGAIVNISSIAGIRYTGYPSISYNASKGAINQLTQNIAMQYAQQGIRANCVLPGLMNTPFITQGLQGRLFRRGRRRDDQATGQPVPDEKDGGRLGCRLCRPVPGIRRGQIYHRCQSARRRRPDLRICPVTAYAEGSPVRRSQTG